MRNRLWILVVCALVIGSASSTAAVTNHNLEWGFEVGYQFHYRYSGSFVIGVIDFYVEIDSLPTIPTNVTSYLEISFSSSHYTFYYENGTEMRMSLSWGAMPIGNWPLIKVILNETSPIDYDWIDTDSEWGVVYTEEYTALIRIVTVRFSKTDGIMNLYHVVDDPEIGENMTLQIARRDAQPIPYLYIGVGVVVVAIIAIVLVVIRRR